MHHRRTRPLSVLAAIVTAGLLAAACGSSGSPSSKKSNDSSPRTASALGPEKKATGTPIKLGIISDGKSETIDNTSELVAEKAAVRYLNDYAGGVGGHPIDAVTCETHQTPSGATDCATKMVDEKVVAVLYGVSGQGGSIFKGLQGSNIPLIAWSGIDQDTLLKPGAFVLGNALAAGMGGPAVVARSAGVKRAAMIVIDVPAASGPVKALARPFYKNAGAEVDIVLVPPGTADMTSQIQAEMAKKPGQIVAFGDSAFCTAALKATKTVGFTGQILVIPQCVDEGTNASIPGGYKGMITLATATTDPSDPDHKVFSAAMDQYAKGTPKGGNAPGGFVVVWAFARAMEGVTGDITAASVLSRFSAMPAPVKLPLGAGITFQCGTKAVAIVPNVCSTAVLQTTLDEKGAGTTYSKLDASDVMKLG